MLEPHPEHVHRTRLFDEAQCAVPRGAVGGMKKRATEMVVMETKTHRKADPPTLEQWHRRLSASLVALLTAVLLTEELGDNLQQKLEAWVVLVVLALASCRLGL